ncbi:MAG: hypothetical protein QGG67_12020 [Gammaproteobacteria bacterium]|nr:hypothetical protein [Gammaproteobacteria bacterium]
MRTSINLDEPLLLNSRYGARTQLGMTSDGSHLIYTRTRRDFVEQETLEVVSLNLVTQQTRILYETRVGRNPPMISPDDERILLTNFGTLDIVPMGEGLTQTLPLLNSGDRPGDWLSDDEIIYTTRDSKIHRRSLLTGVDVALTQLEAGTTLHFLPRALPGGGAFLYTA